MIAKHSSYPTLSLDVDHADCGSHWIRWQDPCKIHLQKNIKEVCQIVCR